MEKVRYSFDEFHLSSSLIRALINEDDNVLNLIESYFSEQSLLEQAKLKPFSKDKRELLAEALTQQNAGLKLSSLSSENIERLNRSNTFTITTGHQLNMATGPLYTLYKILEVINWCEKLNEAQNETYFVPVFWMATEDHDFKEINHVNLFSSKIEWQHQDLENSVVGRISTKSTSSFIDQILNKFNDEALNSKVRDFLKVYTKNHSLSFANRELINELFGDYGLLILDGDDLQLKKYFQSIAQSEIENGITFKTVSETNKALESNGFHQQVYVRESNLFYIEPNGERVRIEKVENGFLLKNKNYASSELLELLDKFPERFSPNALLRPVYQETILPNVAYIGGGGEIAYWLQLKSTFKQLNTVFPLLKVRDSFLLIDDQLREQMDEFGYSILDLKEDTEAILKDFVTKNQTIELSLIDQRKALEDIKAVVLEKALAIDKNATTFIESEFQRMDNQLEKMEKKLIASEKKNQEKSLKKLKRLQARLYPDGGFQERYDTYLNYIKVPDFISQLKTELKSTMEAKASIRVINI